MEESERRKRLESNIIKKKTERRQTYDTRGE